MKSKYIISFDQGTTSSRAILLNEKAEILGISQQELTQYYPKQGWVEHNPREIFATQLSVAKELIQKQQIKPRDVAAIGITNQRETTIVWEKETGNPVYNAIVWQDNRTASFCDRIKKDEISLYIRENTGLVVDSYFSATKIKWILDHVNGAREKAAKGEILFGTVDTWIIWNLTKGKYHVTDASNASRTLLFNIKKTEWDSKLLNYFDIPIEMLPVVVGSSEFYGETDPSLFQEVKIPLCGIAGDQQAALFGQSAFEPGMAKSTYGTGCFMLMNTGTTPVPSRTGLISTIAWMINGKVTYAQEGSIFFAGAAINWLKDGLNLIESPGETQKIAQGINDAGGIYVVPAFSGLGAPYWDMKARGAILGLTQGTTNKHIVRATLESIAYQTKDILNAIEKDTGIELKNLHVDGGVANNDFLMQFLSDILNSPVIRPKNIETTATGAAYLAGLAVKLWSESDILHFRKIETLFEPQMEQSKREELYKGWQKAVSKSMLWIDLQ